MNLIFTDPSCIIDVTVISSFFNNLLLISLNRVPGRQYANPSDIIRTKRAMKSLGREKRSLACPLLLDIKELEEMFVFVYPFSALQGTL